MLAGNVCVVREAVEVYLVVVDHPRDTMSLTFFWTNVYLFYGPRL